MIDRRHVLKAALAAPVAAAMPALARPAIARPADRTLRFIPDGDLQNPDPIWTTSNVVRIHGYMIYDTLYALDRELRPQPQMCAGHELSADQLTWRFTLRENLRFHDGEPVRAADCVASIGRWMQRDAMGQRIAASLNELATLDDKRFELRLKRPFGLMLEALAKSTVNVCFIMPERVAATPANIAISDFTGSGPFRFLRAEWVPGARVAYSRHDGYVPRPEPASYMAGGKKVNVERVDWNIIPDAATAAAAMQSGEQDWWMSPQSDLVDMLRKSSGVVVEMFDFIGLIGILRFNCLQPPFNNQKLRQALLPAIDQQQYMQAAFGDRTDTYRTGLGTFSLGSPLANDAGLEAVTGPQDLTRARRLAKESGYQGERVVLMAATNYPTLDAFSLVTRDLFEKVGLNVDYAATDWGTVVQRRAKREPVDQGGWSAFCTNLGADSTFDPAGHLPLVGTGDKAWFGWPTSPRLEALRDAWYDAPDEARRIAIAREIQQVALQEVPYVPLGQYFSPTAVRKELSKLVKSGVPTFWGVEKGG